MIAEVTQSHRLKVFLETGRDRKSHITPVSLRDVYRTLAGDVVIPTRPDMPRGLHQLGNTCYLNSLLQVRGSQSWSN